MHPSLKWILAAVLGSTTLAAQAQHSDIAFEIEENQIVIEGDGHDHDHDHGPDYDDDHDHGGGMMTLGGQWLFEGDFGDFDGGLYSTDDPGFAAHEGVLNPGEVIGFQGVGSLKFWDWDPVSGTGVWTSDTDAIVSLEDALGAVTEFGEAGVTTGASAFIGAALSDGGFHSHIDFSINSDAAIGGYMIELLLLGFDETGQTEIYSPSDSFLIAFNNGLDEIAFEAGVDAALVPLPGAIWMLSAGLSLLGFARARRSA